MRFICFLVLIFSTDFFAGETELLVETFRSDSFSLGKNGVSIFSNKDVHYNKSTLQITKVSSYIYDFTFAVYLQYTPDSKALTNTSIHRHKVIWNGTQEAYNTNTFDYSEENKGLIKSFEQLLIAGLE